MSGTDGVRTSVAFSKQTVMSGGSWLRSFQVGFLETLEPSGRVLDLGGGDGSFLLAATEKSRNLFETEVLDFYNENALHRLDLSAPNWFESIKGRFDFVICNNVIEHLQNPTILISQLPEVVSDRGGFIVIQTPFLFKEHMSPRDFARYTPDWYVSTLELCGYEEVTVIKQGVGPLTTAFSMLLGPGRVPPRFSLWALKLARLIDRKLASSIFARGEDFFIGVAITASLPPRSKTIETDRHP